MTHSSPAGPPGAAQATGTPAGASAAPAQRWVPITALAIALLAVGLAIVGWFRPSAGSGKFGADQVAQAETEICATVADVREAVVINTHRENVQGDAAGALAVAANARLALYGGGAFLQNQLATQPATPHDLADAADAMATTIQKLGIAYLADAPNVDLQPLRDDLNAELDQLNGLCG